MIDYKEQFHIRYTVLEFTVCMLQNCILSEEKSSMLRGGFGNCLLDNYCISSVKPKPCKKCTFSTACLVQRIMYAPLKISAESVHGNESEGYIIECLDKRTAFFEGDILSFSVTVFGDIIVYLQPILQAFYQLGVKGIGNERAAFQIIEIKNQFGEKLYDNKNIFLNKYKFQYLDDYIQYRLKRFYNINDEQNDIEIKFISPLSIKYHGVILKQFHIGALFNALSIRIYIMNCFEGRQTVKRKWLDGTVWKDFSKGIYVQEERKQLERETEYLPKMEIIKEDERRVERYSFVQKRKISMDGITGKILLHGVTEEMLWYLFAGEVLHAGKHTSFGFGKYHIGRISDE